MPPRRRGSSRAGTSEGGGAPGPPASPVELAIRWLGRGRRFEREVRVFLRKQGFAPAQVAEATVRLKELGLVSDEETCRAFLRDRVRFAPKGRSLLLAEMRRKGAAAAVAEAALDEVLPVEAEVDAAADWLERAARRWRGLPDSAARHRMWGALARRGFPPTAVREAILRVTGEAPADDGSPVDEEPFREEDDGAGSAPEER